MHDRRSDAGSDVSLSGAEWVWILDPLDGTKNFAQGLPNFCVSIAAEWRGELQLGVVCDPIHDEVFLGVRGHGAWCNSRRIHVSRKTTLASAFAGTGCPHSGCHIAACARWVRRALDGRMPPHGSMETPRRIALGRRRDGRTGWKSVALGLREPG